MEIFRLDHFYDFIRKEHGQEYAELLEKLVNEDVSRATGKLMDNIDIYEDGFEDALDVIREYEKKYPKIDYDDSHIEKANKLSKAIYMWAYNNYYADVGD